MADDRYRRVSTNTTPPAPGPKRGAAAAAQQPRPDPLVELARLIGQNETPGGRDPSRAARLREEREALGQRIAQRGQATPPQPAPGQTMQRRPPTPSQPAPDQASQQRTATTSSQPASDQVAQRRTATSSQPTLEEVLRRRRAASSPTPAQQVVQRRMAPSSQPAPEPSVEEGPQYERHPDQRYAGYTEPGAPSQGRSQTRVGHPHDIGSPDLSDPYRTDAGWRAVRPKEQTARPAQERTTHADRAAASPAAASGGDAKRPAPPAQARESVPPAASDSARAPTPTTADYSRQEPAPERAFDAERADESAAYGDAQTVADEVGADAAPERYDEAGVYVYGSEPRNRKLWAAVAILALAVIGTGGAYTYRLMFGGEEQQQQQSPPPVIHADTSPKKIASATQQNNNDKQIQDRLGASGAGEKLVPREEQPLVIKNPNAQSLVPETPPALTAPATTEPSNARPFPAPAGAAGEPKKIRTVTIRPDGNSGSTAPSQAGAPAAAVPAAPVPASPAPAEAAPQSAVPPAPAPTQTAVAIPQPRPSAASAASNVVGYVVQISAQRSQADAEASFRTMQAKYPSVLGGRKPIIQRKESSRGVYYGTQVGPFAARADAIQLCEELKAAGGNCFVQKN